MFRITMLPAQQGDALWIEYGPEDQPHRILIDAGTAPTGAVVRKKIECLSEAERTFELFIVTHIDTDHIGGVLKLLSDLPAGTTFTEVWFNERRHLEAVAESTLGAVDGEILGSFLDTLEQAQACRWNRRFAPGPAFVPDRDGPPPSFELPGDMKITLLSPDAHQVDVLKTAWAKELAEKNLDPNAPDYADQLSEMMHKKGVQPPSVLGDEDTATVEELADQPFVQDDSPANGSTIAILAEHGGRSALLTGDALPTVVLDSVRRLLIDRGQPTLIVDAVKLPHHGSKNNINDDLLGTLISPRWLFSTNGMQHHHPDLAAVARVVRVNKGREATMCFNYPKEANPKAARWDDVVTKDDFGYQTLYADDEANGLLIDL
jgi:beta-lactamase superfamily II metal-dependent hydrolase